MARSYFWWPSIDSDIERTAKSCTLCLESRPEPQKCILTKWPKSLQVFERIYLDYLGPINNKMSLIIIDSYSKWPEVFEVDNAETFYTLEKLKETFARFSLPDTIVSDNDTPFTTIEFIKFCETNGIKHLTSHPFYPGITREVRNYKGKIDNKRFEIGENVYIRDYSKPNKKNWKGIYFKRHVDQIFKLGTFYEVVGLNKKINDYDIKQKICAKWSIITPQEKGDENIVVPLEINKKINDEEVHMQSEIKVLEVMENKNTRPKRTIVKPD
ncbi:uncharacterized protein K02A2.6-like [Rhopalosiphum maidis]|uniref:uncharacterized protein K02A2.6-like n=1 Tax=Rhopalosiphum maidis TaxID=43146 RepID=UPI000F0063DA|nr:uncharacterized protein K02A2.6-like [Rhopalosiphum maidis]